MLRTLTIAAILSIASANAAQWYLLAGSTGECELAKYSPQAMTDMIRKDGRMSSSEIKRDDKGNIIVVLISDRSKDIGLLFFPKREICEKFRQTAIDKGQIPSNPNELR